jgi:uncharacterized protein YwgA/DNA-binding HxlR family transcriptional regulator
LSYIEYGSASLFFDTIRKGKAVDVLLALRRGAKGIREIQEATGGSYSTILDRIEEMLKEGEIAQEYLTGEEFGEIPRNKRLLRLTDQGKRVVDSLIEGGFVKPPSLSKDRQKWIICLLALLGEIRGTTRMMKLLFMLRYDFGLSKGSFFKFTPWIYGPFSDQVVEDLKQLETESFIVKRVARYGIRETKEGKNLYVYTLTDLGKTTANELTSNLEKKEIGAIQKLRLFNNMPLENLIAYVYRKHPQFITRSIILEKILGKSS